MFGSRKTSKMVKKGIGSNDKLEFRLDQNFPNPFAKRTVFSLNIPRACEIELLVQSEDKEKSVILYKGAIEEGSYSIEWNGKDNAGEKLKAGSYVYQLQSTGFIATRKLIIKDNYLLNVKL